VAFVAPLTLVVVPLAALLMLYRPGTREALLAAALLVAMAWRWFGMGAADGFAVFGIAWTLLLTGSLVLVLGRRNQGAQRPVSSGLLTLALASSVGAGMMIVTSFSFDQLQWLAARHFADQTRLLVAGLGAATQNASAATREAVATFESSTQTIGAVVSRYLPGFLLLQSLAALALSWSIYRAVAREPEGAPLPRLREFRFNDHLIWGPVAALLILVLPLLGPLALLGGNLAAFFTGLYLLRGLGVLLALFSGISLGALGATLLVLFVLLFLAPVAALVALAFGVTDTWVDWRTRAAKAKSK
jgi:hypothetical protein